MKVNLITPIDIRYSYRGTEYWVYEAAGYLMRRGIDAEVLITETGSRKALNSKAASEFAEVPARMIKSSRLSLPMNFKITTYKDLPKDSILYFPYSIYDYAINIARKPGSQKWIIGSHSMHLKHGHIIKGHRWLELALNAVMKNVIRKNNLFYHVVNIDQERYLVDLGIEKDRIFRIPPFIDVKDFRAKPSTGKKLKVMHLGGVEKNAEAVSRIIGRLVELGQIGSFEFYLIGKQPESIIQYKKRLKHGSISIFPSISEVEKRKVMGNMDVMLLPAVENFSKSMLEGLASGLYIIAGEMNPAFSEVLKRGAFGAASKNDSEYVSALRAALEMKLDGRLDKYKKSNVSAAEFYDRKVIMPLIEKMFRKVDEA